MVTAPQGQDNNLSDGLSSSGYGLPALLFAGLYLLIAFFVLGAVQPPLPWLAASAMLAVVLALLSSIDLAQYRLPDFLTLPLAAAGLALPWITGGATFPERCLAACLAFAVLAGIGEAYKRLRGRAGLGLGDAKLFAAAGAWLGFAPLATVLLWATGAALAAVIVSAIRGGKIARDTHIAFGPFLAFGFWMTWLQI